MENTAARRRESACHDGRRCGRSSTTRAHQHATAARPRDGRRANRPARWRAASPHRLAAARWPPRGSQTVGDAHRQAHWKSSGHRPRDQYLLPCCRIRSNLAVSATAITAITPAWTGSLTTRSAASGTLPAMFSEITSSPLRADLFDRRGDLAAHDRAGQHQQLDARQPRGGADRRGQLLLADQRNRVDRDALAADVVAVGLGDRAHRDHARPARRRPSR